MLWSNDHRLLKAYQIGDTSTMHVPLRLEKGGVTAEGAACNKSRTESKNRCDHKLLDKVYRRRYVLFQFQRSKTSMNLGEQFKRMQTRSMIIDVGGDDDLVRPREVEKTK